MIEYMSAKSDFLGYFLYSSEQESKADPFVVMRSWLSQLILKSRPAFEIACQHQDSQNGRTASRSDIIGLFIDIVQQVPNCTFIVDGLDECTHREKIDGANSLKAFVETLQRAVSNCASRVLLTSRNDQDIRTGLYGTGTKPAQQNLAEYHISQGDVKSDATKFSRSIVDNKLVSKTEEQKDELSQRMVDRSESTFLWIKMLEEDLHDWKRLGLLQRVIDQAPKGLAQLYDQNWKKIINGRNSSRALSVLRWAAFALRPITIREVSEALEFLDENCNEFDDENLPDMINEAYIKEEILDCCASLVEVRRPTLSEDLGAQTLHLTHFSVKEYILALMPAFGTDLIADERLRASNERTQNNILAAVCLRYLNVQNLWQESVDQRTFRDYAASGWYNHTKPGVSNYASVVTLGIEFVNTKNVNWEGWRKHFDHIQQQDQEQRTIIHEGELESASPLFYASVIGVPEIVKSLVDSNELNVNDTDESKRTGLLAAAQRGFIPIVEYLLGKGADVNMASTRGTTPIYAAAHQGHTEVVKLLLAKGADFTIPEKWSFTALHAALYNGHLDIVELLCEKGADLSAVDGDGGTLLYGASWSGHLDIVKFLLEKGADLTIANNDEETPLHVASGAGHLEVVKYLTEKGADLTVTDVDDWTPLCGASWNGHLEIVKFLFEKGADLMVTDCFGCTPLYAASWNGHIDIVEFLVEKGADFTVTNIEGLTPLHAASGAGHLEIVKFLFDKGANLTVTDALDGTPLYVASWNGHIEVVKFLVEKGAALMAVNTIGWTPLHAATGAGHLKIVKLLVEEGADLTTVDKYGRTPLYMAAWSGHLEIVEFLLEKNTNMELTNNSKYTPLHAASEGGQLGIVEFLLEKGADVMAANDSGWTPLFSASIFGYLEIVQFLLKQPNVDVNYQDNCGRDAFFHAARMGNHLVMEQLLRNNVLNPSAKDRYGITPLFTTVRNGHEKAAEVLLGTDAFDINSCDGSGRNLLWWAKKSGNSSLVQLISRHGAVGSLDTGEGDEGDAGDIPPDDSTIGWCDTCTRLIPDGSDYYECEVCDGGDFYICLDCSKLGLKCYSESHPRKLVSAE